MSDRLIRGLLAEQSVRFVLCEASGLCSEGVQRHQADAISGWLLSEALTCAVLLSVNLKHTEKITLRWQYEGPVGQILADATEEGHVRGFTQRVTLLGEVRTLREAMGDEGRIAAITSLPTRVLHTGITSTVFQDVPRDMAHLLSLSFQVETALAVGLIMPPDPPPGLRSAVGVLLQPMPGADLEAFEAMRQEVEAPAFRAWLEAAPRNLEDVLGRLPGGDGAAVLAETTPAFACGCNRQKVESVLRLMGPDELHEMLVEQGRVEVHCHFCGEAYRFGEAEVHTLQRESRLGNA